MFLGIGSNIERERYITAGLDALHGLFHELALSSVYDSAAIGFAGQPFLNLVAAVHTDLPLAELAAKLRHIEIEHGRPANATRFSARHLDIDILTYDDAVGTFGGVQAATRRNPGERLCAVPAGGTVARQRCTRWSSAAIRSLWQAYDQCLAAACPE